MTPSQSTSQPSPRTDPHRWQHRDTAKAVDHFSAPDHSSQRAYAQAHGIPRSTLGYWLRQDVAPDLDPDLVAFLRGSCGGLFLRRLVLGAFLTFHQEGACGIRLLGRFLERTRLDRFVASSYGALHTLATQLQTDLGLFGAEERARLGEVMIPKTITLTGDEHFHATKPCLVAIEPVSNFILVESYHEHRDGDTWTEAIHEGLSDLPVKVVLFNSDRAKGLIRCARDGLQALHSPDVFHGQRDLLKPFLLPLLRAIKQAEKEFQKAQEHTHSLDGERPAEGPWQISLEEVEQIVAALQREKEATQRVQQAQQHKEQVVQEVRGLGDDYHPFDRVTGRPLTAEEVGARLEGHVARLQEVAEQAGLDARVEETLSKTRLWLGTLVAVVAWFWEEARRQVEELELSPAQERVVYECLLPGEYWEGAAGRARTGAEQRRLQEMAEGLKKKAWRPGGALAALSDEGRQEVERVARQCAGLFSRSSSCVEGRNGRLSLHHHGQGRLSEAKLQALTTVHNYLSRRSDGTTAAERFFGAKPRDLFTWLLRRMPDLPRPAAKRPRYAAQAMPQHG